MAESGRSAQIEKITRRGSLISPEDTIAAVATPLGTGGLGVVRLSGPGAVAAAERIARRSFQAAASHSLHHVTLYDGETPLDDAVVGLFRTPRSYTGEDVVEISCHGGPLLVRRVLALCLNTGAREAMPGEFTKRAYLNGKMDLAQAEAVAALISASSEDFRRAALGQLQGALSNHVKELRTAALRLLAHLEANLDFAEDEVPDLSRATLVKNLESLRRDAAALLATAPRGRLWREGLRVVLLGKPNVGKSSLFNVLVGSDRAIVARRPGTTRDILEETAVMDGVPVALTDTAGLRAAADEVETEGIARAGKAVQRADVVLFLTDASAPLTEEDLAAAENLDPVKTIWVKNKNDRVMNAADPLAGALKLRPRAVLPVSAATGQGIPELQKAVLAATGGAAEAPPDRPTLISLRHEKLLGEALSALDQALASARSGKPDEAVSLDLRRSLDPLGSVTGEGAPEELLDEIFSSFCIGK